MVVAMVVTATMVDGGDDVGGGDGSTCSIALAIAAATRFSSFWHHTMHVCICNVLMQCMQYSFGRDFGKGSGAENTSNERRRHGDIVYMHPLHITHAYGINTLQLHILHCMMPKGAETRCSRNSDSDRAGTAIATTNIIAMLTTIHHCHYHHHRNHHHQYHHHDIGGFQAC